VTLVTLAIWGDGLVVLASLVHLGLTLRLGFLTLDDPFAGAAIPTAMIVLGRAKR
jgi:hypothetical protein